MARKLSGFERVLDAPSLFAVAYSEIGSSLYFALGIVAARVPVIGALPGDLPGYWLDYRLRSRKGHFYRKRYPTLAVV